ncbi:MAG: 4-hydroxy-tetrahydrodipicolinate reductase [Cardiobacteriaceae bacterium]|nr:4-hydroxy-tetrahydrodipicolinate reductase [Cardiobacteriaceae bacterium]
MKIAIHGINGKMGLAIAKSLENHADLQLAGASVRSGHAWAGKRLSEVSDLAHPVRITANLDQLCAAADVVVDFTRPDATLSLLPVCERANKPLLVGTTGFNRETAAWLERAAGKIPLLLAANTSIGVNVLAAVCRQVAAALAPEQWDVDILEAHHRQKVDAPSGTAIKLGRAIAEAQGSDFEARMRYPYQDRRKAGDIGFAVLRSGEIVGEHTVFFNAAHEQLSFSHRAHDRRIFADGALTAARWLVGRPAGFYDMEDVLGL